MPRLSSLAYTILILISITLSYLWIELPFLAPFSLQAIAITVLLYLILKKFNNSKLWHIAPAAMSLEMALATFAFNLLVGFTGGIESILFPLIYVQLFFLVFSSPVGTSIYVSTGMILFYYALGIEFSTRDITSLITIPLTLIFFIFAKTQYQELQEKNKQIEEEEQLIADEKQEVTELIETHLKPKLEKIKQLTDEQSGQEIEEVKEELESLEGHLEGYVADRDL